MRRRKLNVKELDELNQESFLIEGIVAVSKQMLKIIEQAKRLAPSKINVLITGETGVGKQVLTELIHQKSERKGELVILNSAGLPETLVESELFGHKKGTFTDARENTIGFFEQAKEGTLFLDEIGDMSLTVQSKILQAVEDKEFYWVGSRRRIKVDVRLISSSNQPLEERIKEGKFRADLFYRLNVARLDIPPLRERPEDILPLILHFVKKSCSEFNEEVQLSREAWSWLLNYHWPGNVRQLERAIEQAVVLAQDGMLGLDDFQSVLLANSLGEKRNNPGLNLRKNKEEAKKKVIIKALEESDWSQTKAARQLGIQRTYLNRLMKKYNILWLKQPASCTKKEKKEPEKKKQELSGLKISNFDTESRSIERRLAEVERRLLIKAFEKTNWVQTAVAQLLGISQSTICQKIKQYNIRHPAGSWRKNSGRKKCEQKKKKRGQKNNKP